VDFLHTDSADPSGLALYLVYRDLALMLDWLSGTLGVVEKARAVNAWGVVTNAEVLVGDTTLLLERGDLQPDAYPRGTRWTGVWVDDPDA
jgi:hypothetical protein